MYTTLRQYAGITPTVFDTFMSRKADVETLIRQVPGFLHYDLVRTADGFTTVTVCKDQAGTDESSKQVSAWIAEHLPALQSKTPTITAGENVLHFSAN
jgi:hypothetical protein